MKAAGIIRRIGPDKGGHWEVIERSMNTKQIAQGEGELLLEGEKE